MVMNRNRISFGGIIWVLSVLWEQSNEYRERGGGGGKALEASDHIPTTTSLQVLLLQRTENALLPIVQE